MQRVPLHLKVLSSAMTSPVLILFFNRPDTLAQVFAAVREARPPVLFLYQDGARGEKDLAGIAACREVVSHIDWPCQVHRLYQERNYGCDPSEFISQRWAFGEVERCIVLEDDDVPSQSFFTFCDAMLERYKDDERVGIISGFNTDEKTTDIGADDYFFTTNFSIWGWASWRRVVAAWDEHYTWLDDPTAVARIEALSRERKLRSDFLPMCRTHRDSGKAYYETIFHAHLLLHSQMAIVPRVNMIRNIGVSDDSTHFGGSIATLPHAYRRIFTMSTHNLDTAHLTAPAHIIDHTAYRKRVYRTCCWGHPWLKVARSIEELWLNLKYGNYRRITQAARERISIWLGGRNWH
ncbi:MAG: hemolysin activation protein [Bacteroidales bacterium]|nr:hemolysin activation protein [Candidatus Equimonas enterica]